METAVATVHEIASAGKRKPQNAAAPVMHELAEEDPLANDAARRPDRDG